MTATPASSEPQRLHGDVRAKLGAFTLDTGPFDWPLQGVTALFGRSGCGKTSLLRTLAGLTPHARGHLRAGDAVWMDGRRHLPPQRRDVGYVFQDAALFPHLDVRGNLAFAARRAPDRAAAMAAIAGQAEAAGISRLLDRPVGALSGGEKQRVAIARALLSQPKLLLLDEPLAALDWRAKDALLDLIDRLASELGLPMVLVSHAPEEIERLAERVVFLQDGRITGTAPLQEALMRPDSPLFDRLGPVAVVQGSARPLQDGLALVRIGGHDFILPGGTGAGEVRVRVYARDVALARRAPTDLSIRNALPVALDTLAPSRAGHVLLRLRLPDGQGLWSEITEPAVRALGLAPGDALFALVKTASLQR